MHLYIEKMKKKARQKLVFWLASKVFTGLYIVSWFTLCFRPFLKIYRDQEYRTMVSNIWMKLFRFFSEVEVNIPRATRNSSAYLSNRQISNKSWSNRNRKRITEFVMPWEEVIIFGLFSKLTVLRCSLLTKLPVSAKIMRCS